MVPVFYATDREALTAGPLNYGMTRNPGGVLFLGRFDVSIPRDERHRIGRIERPTIWTFWREDPNQHFVIANRRRHSYDEFYADLRGVVAKSDRKEAFVFIHGFNVGFEAAVFRTAQIAYDLGFDGAPILYSWPSVAALTPTGYAMDVENNDWTVPHLGWFLEDVARKAGAARVHLIAHGVGNKALLKALDRIPRVTTARFAQVVLTAPDIDVDTFDQLADAVRRNAMRTTLYASSSDRALVASKRIHPYRRAGDASAGVVVVPGIDSVDVTAVDTDFVDHSFHAENRSVISDMFLLITQGLMPSQRPKLRPVGTAPRQFWRFVP
jgi:esterase/lipase superfamily enzyme